MNEWNLPNKVSFTVKELQSILGHGKNKIYKLLGLGKNPVKAKIKSKLEGRRRIVLYPWLVKYLEELENTPSE